MHQLEIQYFFPLTEQIPLDLDYTRSKEYEKQKQQEMWASAASGQVLMAGGTGLTTWSSANTISFRPETDSVGYWELGEGFQFHNKKKPNWLHQKMVAMLMGLKWNDK